MRSHKQETVTMQSAIVGFPPSVMAKEYDLTIGMFSSDCKPICRSEGRLRACSQARSTPPVRLPTSATILAASASISASVMVLSRGCKVTAIAIDFLPGSMPWPS